MNYNTTFNVFSETSWENYYYDNNFDYCEFYRTVGLEDSEDNVFLR